MLTHKQGRAVSSKQPLSNQGHSSIIRSEVARGARKTRNRPFGIVPARIARIEGLLEAYAALADDEDVFCRCSRTLAHIRAQRKQNRAAFTRKGIDIHTYEVNAEAYDSAEYNAAVILAKRALRLRKAIRPEVKRCIQIAERAA